MPSLFAAGFLLAATASGQEVPLPTLPNFTAPAKTEPKKAPAPIIVPSVVAPVTVTSPTVITPTTVPALNATPVAEPQVQSPTFQPIRPVAAQGKDDKKVPPPQPAVNIQKGGDNLHFTPAGRGVTPYAKRTKTGIDDSIDVRVYTELPGLERLTQRISETTFLEGIRQENVARGATRQIFPERVELSKEVYQGRSFPRAVCTVEPSYVCHGRLLWEQPNFDRHGWDLGPMTPFVQSGVFIYDTALLPYHYYSRPCETIDCSAGKCLPGDPTPFLLYRERFSVTGLAAQAGFFGAGMFLFP